MTLREEILKNAGLLTEDTLEEGKLGKALGIAAIIGLIAAAVIKGPDVKYEYNKYKYVSNKSVATKYREADNKASYDISNWERNTDIYTSYSYSSGKRQPILNIDIKMLDYVKDSVSGKNPRTVIAEEIGKIISKQLDAYIESIKSNSSIIEKFLSKDTYIGNVKPLKVQLDFKADSNDLLELDSKNTYKEKAEYEFDWLSRVVGMNIANVIARKLDINSEYVDIYINGKSASFKH